MGGQGSKNVRCDIGLRQHEHGGKFDRLQERDHDVTFRHGWHRHGLWKGLALCPCRNGCLPARERPSWPIPCLSRRLCQANKAIHRSPTVHTRHEAPCGGPDSQLGLVGEQAGSGGGAVRLRSMRLCLERRFRSRHTEFHSSNQSKAADRESNSPTGTRRATVTRTMIRSSYGTHMQELKSNMLLPDTHCSSGILAPIDLTTSSWYGTLYLILT